MTEQLDLNEQNLPDETATVEFGQDLALALQAGDCVALWGDLGAGKSTLCRALLRAIADDPDLEVPSPTFTLVQSYEIRIPVSHFDLYRLADVSELDELGFDEALSAGICLVEWPERAGRALPKKRIDIRFQFTAEGGRIVSISAPEAKMARLHRVWQIRRFLDDQGFPHAARRHLTGDASSRAYEHIYPGNGDARLVLMDAPARPNGPPIRDGKPYSQIVHLAEDVYPFVAIDEALRARGFAAPAILAADCDSGILLLEDLGTEGVLDPQGNPIEERYRAAAACLAAIHDASFDRKIHLKGGDLHVIPDFDRPAMKMEVELLLDWHLPWKRNGAAVNDVEREAYLGIWDSLIDELAAVEKSIVLRDFHSPNIIWRGDRTGHDRIGLIDFQDAMMGPSAYDLVSLVQDARVTIPRPLMDQLMADYLALRNKAAGFDEAGFLKGWAIMSAQRACKLNGLWVRLLKRDGKPGYMRHMPRTLWHLSVAFEHPVLTPLRSWCAEAGIELPESAA
ncbi:tRNA (adenosine(37)-N6)-threonylcarbamoyltransferase complex ATPase subunit type 1 TsaE [Rhizobium glycinendophyticum]|uniref:tRNA threonylcarbamoyladenosine biosynthesis protein TsaE n=1 Tax=Rhizobium glycinendophyticum TaxID=2589807 RepID=A0A504UQH5_9HYPH|nr:tRNA (adenosine(37)-N6)-threonylcarbamoyltransferase complex ATPase subunit type 1 TsaE [Rhizobium glycinendophyticum]TPP07323.1 tRNA (adenosine(37)-N6)-threonylcarbamoyltransferase complex ATPase subunit type 1 TsaE [Rhizobium glycinendophyticum]